MTVPTTNGVPWPLGGPEDSVQGQQWNEEVPSSCKYHVVVEIAYASISHRANTGFDSMLDKRAGLPLQYDGARDALSAVPTSTRDGTYLC